MHCDQRQKPYHCYFRGKPPSHCLCHTISSWAGLTVNRLTAVWESQLCTTWGPMCFACLVSHVSSTIHSLHVCGHVCHGGSCRQCTGSKMTWTTRGYKILSGSGPVWSQHIYLAPASITSVVPWRGGTHMHTGAWMWVAANQGKNFYTDYHFVTYLVTCAT